MKKELILLGGGGHCKACIDVIEAGNEYKILGILDQEELIGEKVLGYDIIGSDSELIKLSKTLSYFLVTVGQITSPDKRIELFRAIKEAGGKCPIIISPHAYVAKSARIAEGSIIMHHALLNANAQIGPNCIINSKALIEHDTIIHQHCHVSTAAVVNGHCTIGEGSFVGSGSVTIQNANIAPNSFIKANSIAL